MGFSKTFHFLFEMAHLTPAPLTPALINASRQNNAELGPAEKGPIRYVHVNNKLMSIHHDT